MLSPPVISTQPSDQTVIVGAPVIFTVGAAGSPPLGYQWQFNSAAIAGATQSAYSLASAQATNAGTYSAVVSNAYGTAVSSNAVLTVRVAAEHQHATFEPNGDRRRQCEFHRAGRQRRAVELSMVLYQTNLLDGATRRR